MGKNIFRCLCFSLAATTSSFASTLTVDLNGGADHTDIQSAIDAAADGDTVLVKPGEYVIAEPIDFKGKAIAVKSEGGASATMIRMSETPADSGRASVVVFENGEGEASVLEGFALRGGKGSMWGGSPPAYAGGGGVLCKYGSSPTLENCTISGNGGGCGGGLY